MVKTYRSFISHLHSAFEGPASMEGFCSEAAATGIDMVWFSDHDTRIVRCSEPFDVPRKVPILTEPTRPGPPLWWEVVEGVEITPPFPWLIPPVGEMPPRIPPQAHAAPAKPELRDLGNGVTAVRVQAAAAGGWQAATLSLRAPGSRWARPLRTRPVIEIGLDTDIRPDDPDRRLVVEIEFGQRPPMHELANARYVWGHPGELGAHEDLSLRDGRVSIDLARAAASIGVPDDHLPHRFRIRLESRRGAIAEARLGELSMSSERCSPDDLLQWQAKRAEDLGQRYGVQTLVGYELSGTGTHLVAYGHLPPLIEHRNAKPVLPHAEAARTLRDQGCVLSLNHPFSAVRKALESGISHDDIVRQRAEQIRENDAYGAQLIEVGFPVGRQGFSLAHYLALWDRLNRWGLRLYGVGVSDAHANYRWDAGNNFANYAPVRNGDAREWTAALERGDFFMADPVRFRGSFELATDKGTPMGGMQSGGEVRLMATGLPAGCTLEWIVDGRPAERKAADGAVESRLSLDGMRHFVRAEISTRDGRVILLSNPVWASA